MGTVSHNAGLISYMMDNRFNSPASSQSMFRAYAKIYIFSADPNIAAVTTRNGIEILSGRLLTWTTGSTLTAAKVDNQTFQFTSTLSAAEASGVATHFVIWGSSTSSDAAQGWGIKGTVGLTGSGSDMELGNTSIVASELYTVNWSFNVYKEFTY